MMNSIHTESTFESAIIEHLTNNGWHEGNAADFSSELALDKKSVLDFIQTSQPKEWEQLKSYYREETEAKFIQRLFKELDLCGMLDVIRQGITDSGVKQVEGICSLSTKAANDLVSLFVQQGILKKISGQTRYRFFLFESYLNLFR